MTSQITDTDSNYVRIFDTSMRDGEQSPGATMTSDEKLKLARALARLGVDILEVGFPAASRDDLLAVKQVSEQIGSGDDKQLASARMPTICGLARAKRSDIDTCWEAVRNAAKPRIHTFVATSPIHREHKLRMRRHEVIATIREAVAYARERCDDVEFSAEDAGRTEPEFLYEAVTAAIEAGATTVNIPDTVGYTMPDEFGAIITGIRRHVSNIDRAVISVHCHDDLGLATANTLAGLRAGARQAEVTINGIGERAGNTALEEVVMALRTRPQIFDLTTGIETQRLSRVSKLVSQTTGMRVQPNKAIVGANAFAHEAGIHQDGMLKHSETYEIMRPETVGVAESQLILGKHSGRHAFSVRLNELGYFLGKDALREAFLRFKELADAKKYITDADIEALASSEQLRPAEYYAIEELQVGCGTRGMSTATVRLRTPDGGSKMVAMLGSGPVHACFKAIDHIVESDVALSLLEYSVHSITHGIDALGEVSVRIGGDEGDPVLNGQDGKLRARAYHGQVADTDIVLASAKAYVAAINRRMAHVRNGGKMATKPEARELAT
ncbi:MAG: 2-isopropylmalate synthase [Nannocystaceae bacterium]